MPFYEDKEKMSDEQHCFCQSKDTDRFMIGCDECNKWFHGDCVNVTEQNAKSIVHFYCPPCMQANSRLSIVSKESLAAARKSSMATGASSASQPKAVESSAPSTGCGQCIGCFRTTDCGKCDGCKGGQRCKGRICVNTDVPSMKKPKKISAPVGRPPKSKQLQMKKTPPKQNKGGRQPLKGGKANGAAGRGTRSSIQAYQQFMKEAGMISSDEDEKGGRQCFGLKCTQAARKGSKYCSDECGLALAKARLCAFLPARVASYWGTTPQAEVMQKSQLEDVRDRQRKARDRLAQLDDEVRSLDDWVETVMQLVTTPEEDAPEDEDDDHMVYCAVCGMECSARQMPRHVARCFAKYESQSSYGSAFKAAHNPYNLFCDAYNKVNGTYCKRLRIICPEHSKGSRSDELEEKACGCPKNWTSNIIPDLNEVKTATNLTDVLCTVMRKKCRKHYQWDKIARAQIDSERLSHLFKLDELFEEERALCVSLASRGSVVALLTHNTISAK